jgi:hypothetical protein
MARFFTGLFGAKQTQPPATAMRVNTALQGVPIAILLCGQNRMAGNLIHYFGFRAISGSGSSGGKGGITGGGSKGQGSTTTYQASFLLAHCAGPVPRLVNVWINGSLNNVETPAFYGGDYTQTPWGLTLAIDPSQALAYRGIAYTAWPNYPLGSSPSTPNITVEIQAANFGFIPGQPDGDPSVALRNWLFAQPYSLGFPAARYGEDSPFQAYCRATGFAVSPIIPSAVTAGALCNDILTACNSNWCWDSGQLTPVPYGDQPVQAGQISQITETHVVPAPGADGYSRIIVGNVGTYVADLGVTYLSGAPLSLDKPPVQGTYEVAPPGTYVFNALDQGQTVLISYSYAATASYIPDTEILYDFTIDDMLPNQGSIGQGAGGGNLPLIVVRKPRDAMLNSIKVEYLDRNNAYNPVDIEYKDEASITAFGRTRAGSVKQFHFFCTASAAQQSAVLQLGREQIARTFQWTVGKHFILILRVLKLVTVTVGIYNRQPVRITEIQENTDGSITITGEEFLGTATSPLYGTQAANGFQRNFNADPGSINPPIIFEPTDELSNALSPGGGLVIAGAVSGINTALWGGCHVWASYDGSTYERVGAIFGPARMGVLTAALPSVTANPTGPTIDTTSVLSVDLSESAGTLASGTALDATSLNTRCFVGPALGPGQGEIISYETAALTAAAKYNLTYLVRGAYGTEAEIATWPVGTSFARLDQGIFAFPYDQSRIGSTLYLKFTSFNIYQGGEQSLANVGAIKYTITGSALASPLPSVTNVYSNYEAGFQKIYWDEIEDFRNGIVYEIREGATFASALFLRTQAHPPFIAQGNGTFWITGRCQPISGLTVYSEAPVSIAIAGNQLTSNIIKSWDEQATGWPGTFDNGIGVSGGNLRLGGAGNILTDADILSTPDLLSYGGVIVDTPLYYTVGSAHYIDIGYVAQAAVNGSTTIVGVPIGQNVLTIPNVLTIADFLGAASTPYVDGWLEISVSQTGIDVFAPPDVFNLGGANDVFSDTYAWGSWQKFVPGVFPGRVFQMRLALESFDPNTTAEALSFTWSVQVPARIDHYNALSVPSGGLTITFKPDGAATAAPFNFGPNNSAVPYVNVTFPDPSGARLADYTASLTLSQVTISFVDTSGNPVAVSKVNVDVEGA